MWGILLLALTLRLPLLNQSLWLDESLEALALQGHFGPLLSYSLSDFQPPLYHFILQAWTSLTGYSELALRFPSLLAGLLTVYFMIKFGELLGSRKLGLIAGLLAATNPLLIYYSQEGRTYMMTTLFVTMSFYFLLKRSSLAYLLSTLLAIWSSYLACLIVPLQLLYLLHSKRLRLALALTLTSLTLLFWLPSFWNSLQIGLGDAGSIPGWGRVVGGITAKALVLTWVKTAIGRISFTPPWLYASVMLTLFALHGYVLRHAKKIHPLLLIWLSTLALAAFVSLFVPAYSYTRVLFVVPSYLLILALGLSHLPRLSGAIALMFNLIFLSIFWFIPRFHREDWRSLVSYLNTQSGTVVLPSLKQDAPLNYYGLNLPLSGSTDFRLSGSKIFYIKYVEDIFDPSRLGPANLTNLGYTLTSQKTYPGLQLDIYENSH